MILVAYVQDKMEFKDALVTLVGLRFDYFNPNGTGDALLLPSDMSNAVVGYDTTGYAIFNEPEVSSAQSFSKSAPESGSHIRFRTRISCFSPNGSLFPASG